MALKVGSRLRATSSSCEVVVVRGTEEQGTVLLAGAPMSMDAAAGQSGSEGPALSVGKRYTDADPESNYSSSSPAPDRLPLQVAN